MIYQLFIIIHDMPAYPSDMYHLYYIGRGWWYITQWSNIQGHDSLVQLNVCLVLLYNGPFASSSSPLMAKYKNP